MSLITAPGAEYKAVFTGKRHFDVRERLQRHIWKLVKRKQSELIVRKAKFAKVARIYL